MVSPARRRIVFNAIKSAILKQEETEFWIMKMYEQQDKGVLTDDQVAELEEIIESLWPDPEPEPEPEQLEEGEE